MIPDIRITCINNRPVRHDGTIVLYWMIAARRTCRNFGLQHAAEQARALNLPLVVFEALRVGHRWASDRFHQFVIDGMRDNQAALASTGVGYYPYLERTPGEGRGLLEALARRAALVVTDGFPSFFLPRMVEAAGRVLDVRLEAVDSNGLLPLRALDAVFPTAYAFRRALQKTLPAHLPAAPLENPFAGSPLVEAPPLETAVTTRWPHALQWLDEGHSLAELPIDHTIRATETRGGSGAATRRLTQFLDEDLPHYGEHRNEPERDIASRLSPYLHWGHLSAHEVFDALMAREGWLGHLPTKATGSREGWWGLRPGVESFLDEFITWREVGYNFTSKQPGYDTYESLPAWARKTLDLHAGDERDALYTLAQFEQGTTRDPLWNAAQHQLVTEGRIHNYLRMLWGKKILEWTKSPRDALAVMIELNNKYALDGRNPNSYTGIMWTLGRYDRPWAPERDVFGVIRYMSSENTARKMRVKNYIRRYGEPSLQ